MKRLVTTISMHCHRRKSRRVRLWRTSAKQRMARLMASTTRTMAHMIGRKRLSWSLCVFFAAEPGEEFVDVVEVFGELDAQALLVGQFGAGVVAGVVAVESVEAEVGVEFVAYLHIAHKHV